MIIIATGEERIEILEKRDFLVVKANELIQKNRFELSLPEQKTIAFIISMIKPITEAGAKKSPYYPDSPWQLEYEFNIRDYCKICGIEYDSGKNYADIKATLKKLSDRSMWLDDGNGEVLVRWLSKARTNKRSGIILIEIDRDLAPFLFELKGKFTQYQLYNILAMKSAFSVRIYELMKSYAYQKSKTFEIDELKRLLRVEDVKTYKNFADFKRRVLDKAQEEINELTDLNIAFEPVTKGRKTVSVIFRIETKSERETILRGRKVNNVLGLPEKK